MTCKYKFLEEELTNFPKLQKLVKKIAEEKCNYHLQLINKLLHTCKTSKDMKQTLIKQRMEERQKVITTYMILRR